MGLPRLKEINSPTVRIHHERDVPFYFAVLQQITDDARCLNSPAIAAVAARAQEMAGIISQETLYSYIQRRVANDDMSSEAEEDVKKISPLTKEMVNVRCNVVGVETHLPKSWSDNIDHDCMDIEGTLPLLQAGWTPLHVAASCARRHCTRLLLAAGANPNIEDVMGRTPLDVAGSGYYFGQDINSRKLVSSAAVKAAWVAGVCIALEAGADVTIRAKDGETPIHCAAALGDLDVLNEILSVSKQKDFIDCQNEEGETPLFKAILFGHLKCVDLILNEGASIKLTMPGDVNVLHVAAELGHVDILKHLVEYNDGIAEDMINNLTTADRRGFGPIHFAVLNNNVDCLKYLLTKKSDIRLRTTDSPFKSSTPLHIAALKNFETIAKVILGHDRTTIHEVNNMGWNPLHTAGHHGSRDIITLLLQEGADLSGYTDGPNTADNPPALLNPQAWGQIVYITIFLIMLQEILYMNTKSMRYFSQLETWIKFLSIALAAILPPTVALVSIETIEWPRHVATSALLCSWIELMFLLSRFPNWGYYFLMFGKVASNVIKILLTFAFLVVGFSLSFMIQFRSKIPFDGPWAAFVKTMVMMTSEFDYNALFDQEHSQELATSLVIVRLIFLVFLILAAIVLMNLMVGVAVNDINDLEILGNIRRLAKQAEFLSRLDNLVYNRFFTTVLPRRLNNRIKNKRNVMGVITFCPGRAKFRIYKSLPSHLKNAIIDKANAQKKQLEEEFHLEVFKTKIDEMHEAITKKKYQEAKKDDENQKEQPLVQKIKYEDIFRRLNSLDESMTEVKAQVKTNEEDAKLIEELNVKMDQMSLEIEVIKQFLSRLESKVGSL
ncbi:jg12914 [Pararge aegeria aegeria]|uniref:Jg12914 protein n=1 Tax=Pararge aegeria aegeria TaxID=348720 RepID=A0A8S4S1W2_9NEOP|nr:jg12914 [Pararge aegeria aegeria]